jgi:hypothetical protein
MLFPDCEIWVVKSEDTSNALVEFTLRAQHVGKQTDLKGQE